MSDFLKEYYETKVMQSMGMIDSDINPVEYAEKNLEDKHKEKENDNFKEIENHMVIGEYYDNQE